MAMAAVARLIFLHSLPPSLSPHGLHSRRPPKPLVLVAAQSIGPAIPGHGDQPSPYPFRLPFAPLVAPPPPLSEIVWPAAGAFAAMAFMGGLDKLLEPRGLTFTIAPFGAVSALLFAAPQAPAARKYNVFLSHMGCAALGVAALAVFGPGWIARSVALAASVAFMQFTGCFHPPAAGLPLLFIDGPKFHHLQWLYVLFPGAAGCVLLCLLVSGSISPIFHEQFAMTRLLISPAQCFVFSTSFPFLPCSTNLLLAIASEHCSYVGKPALR